MPRRRAPSSRLHRPLEGTPKTVTIVKTADGWYGHIVCELDGPRPVTDTNPVERAALDLGVEALWTLQTGERVTNSRLLARATRKLLAEQRALSRTKPGSKRGAKQRERVARAHLKVARVRRDYLHKQAGKLAERYRFIAVEDLAVVAMTQGTIERPGWHVTQKAVLNRSILEAGWGELVELLEYKVAARGGALIRVASHGTSQVCSGCGAHVPKPLNERWHDCPHYGLSLQRDHTRRSTSTIGHGQCPSQRQLRTMASLAAADEA